MALPLNGIISFADIAGELYNDRTRTISLNDSDVRNLAGIPTGPISLSDFYGKSKLLPSTISIAIGGINYVSRTNRILRGMSIGAPCTFEFVAFSPNDETVYSAVEFVTSGGSGTMRDLYPSGLKYQEPFSTKVRVKGDGVNYANGPWVMDSVGIVAAGDPDIADLCAVFYGYDNAPYLKAIPESNIKSYKCTIYYKDGTNETVVVLSVASPNVVKLTSLTKQVSRVFVRACSDTVGADAAVVYTYTLVPYIAFRPRNPLYATATSIDTRLYILDKSIKSVCMEYYENSVLKHTTAVCTFENTNKMYSVPIPVSYTSAGIAVTVKYKIVYTDNSSETVDAYSVAVTKEPRNAPGISNLSASPNSFTIVSGSDINAFDYVFYANGVSRGLISYSADPAKNTLNLIFSGGSVFPIEGRARFKETALTLASPWRFSADTTASTGGESYGTI